MTELNKWILLDPSFNTYFNYDDIPLSINELKSVLLQGKEPCIINYCLNKTIECQDIYLPYFIKQLLTNLATWADNSMTGRKYSPYNWTFKKEFRTNLPE